MKFDEIRLIPSLALAVALSLAGATACSSEERALACGGRGETIHAGTSKVSSQGYRFELLELSPAQPVQSDGAPGNRWTVRISEPSGAPAEGGTLTIATLMPDHGHPGTPAAAVEVETEAGTYDVSELVFSMPTLFVVTLTFTPRSGQPESVQLMLCLDVASG